MRKRILAITLLVLLVSCSQPATEDFASQIDNYDHLAGYFDMYWDESLGRLIIRVDRFAEPFLYQSSLARGVGSNDIGLDRGQLGSTRVVQFLRSGPKVLLTEENLDYRVLSENIDEQNAVQESFARSVVWGFEVLGLSMPPLESIIN